MERPANDDRCFLDILSLSSISVWEGTTWKKRGKEVVVGSINYLLALFKYLLLLNIKKVFLEFKYHHCQ